MLFKKKIISRELAKIIYILEKDSNVNAKAYFDVLDIIWDVAYFCGGYKGMDNAFKHLVDLRKRGAE